jgi:lactoylglutathione lyase
MQKERAAIPVSGLFETHITVRDLDRSVAFYRDLLGLTLATIIEARRVAFFWVGGPGHAMIGVWETGTSPMTMRQHFAFVAALEDVLRAPDTLRAAGVEPRGEPIVYGWMPALAVFCDDPDGHSVEYLAMLPEAPRPDLGIVSWDEWRAAADSAR